MPALRTHCMHGLELSRVLNGHSLVVHVDSLLDRSTCLCGVHWMDGAYGMDLHACVDPVYWMDPHACVDPVYWMDPHACVDPVYWDPHVCADPVY